MDPQQLISFYSKNLVLGSILVLFVLSAISLKIHDQSPNTKRILFFSIAFVAVFTTLFLSASTIFLNVISSSKGPVHHHADFEIWACGQEHEFEEPRGLSNKIGTETVHSHNDKRIHIEGVLVKPEDASLGEFFESVGGKLSKDSISFPGHEGLETLKTGDSCPNVKNPQLQIFIYKVQGKFYTQSKIKDPQKYIISPENNVPPGDCVIVELDFEKPKTEKLCRSFEVAKQTGKLQGELKY